MLNFLIFFFVIVVVFNILVLIIEVFVLRRRVKTLEEIIAGEIEDIEDNDEQ